MTDNTTSTTVTVVGTGGMGSAVAHNLLKAGYAVSVWNRSEAPTRPLVEAGATRLTETTQIFDSGVVLSVLADDTAVREVFLDSGALDSAPEGAVHVNLATISPAFAAELAETHATHGVDYLAAPMFGGVPVAQAGKLNIVTAGPADVQARVAGMLAAVSTRIWPVGAEPHKANVVKVAGQVLIAAAIQSMSEAVSIVEDGGIDAHTAVDLFTGTITPGPVYSNYGGLIADARYRPAGFTPVLGRKDVDLARAQAETGGLQLPVADLLSSLLTTAVDEGHADEDWAVLADLQRHRRQDNDR